MKTKAFNCFLLFWLATCSCQLMYAQSGVLSGVRNALFNNALHSEKPQPSPILFLKTNPRLQPTINPVPKNTEQPHPTVKPPSKNKEPVVKLASPLSKVEVVQVKPRKRIIPIFREKDSLPINDRMYITICIEIQEKRNHEDVIGLVELMCVCHNIYLEYADDRFLKLIDELKTWLQTRNGSALDTGTSSSEE